jgi:hypothetical protein
MARPPIKPVDEKLRIVLAVLLGMHGAYPSLLDVEEVAGSIPAAPTRQNRTSGCYWSSPGGCWLRAWAALGPRTWPRPPT